MTDKNTIEELNEDVLAEIQGGGTYVVADDTDGETAEAAARMSCQNNLKQLGIAAH